MVVVIINDFSSFKDLWKSRKRSNLSRGVKIIQSCIDLLFRKVYYSKVLPVNSEPCCFKNIYCPLVSLISIHLGKICSSYGCNGIHAVQVNTRCFYNIFDMNNLFPGSPGHIPDIPTLPGGFFVALIGPVILPGLHQSLRISLLQHLDEVIHLRHQPSFRALRLCAPVFVSHGLQAVCQVSEPLPDLLPKGLVLLLELRHHLADVALAQHGLHGVRHHFFKSRIPVDLPPVLLGLYDLPVDQFPDGYTLLSVPVDQQVRQLPELHRAPFLDEVGQLMGHREHHGALAEAISRSSATSERCPYRSTVDKTPLHASNVVS